MKKVIFALAAVALLAPAVSSAQNTTPTPQRERRMNTQDRKNSRMERTDTLRTVVNNPQDDTSGTPLNSQRETDLKNGGADRTGGQTAR